MTLQRFLPRRDLELVPAHGLVRAVHLHELDPAPAGVGPELLEHVPEHAADLLELRVRHLVRERKRLFWPSGVDEKATRQCDAKRGSLSEV